MAFGMDFSRIQQQQQQANQQQPQQNQFLTGNPATQPNANTNWMMPHAGSGMASSGSVAPSNSNSSQGSSLAAPQGTMLGQVAAGNTGPAMGSREWLQNYTDPRGTGKKLTPQSVDYWAGKFNEDWAQKDPAFYQKFLGNAEEFTGGPEQTRIAMGWGPTPQQSMLGMNNQPQGLGMFQALMPQIMQMLQGGQMRQTHQMPQQASNGGLFGQAGQQGNNVMDISSFLNPAAGAMRKVMPIG